MPSREKLEVRHCSIEYIFSKKGKEEYDNIKLVTKERFELVEFRV